MSPERRPADRDKAPQTPHPAEPPSRAKDLLGRLDRGLSAAERALLTEERERTRAELDGMRMRVEAYDRLAACSRSLTSILDLDVLLGAILQEVVTLSGVDRAFLLLQGPGGPLRIERGFDRERGHLDAGSGSEVSQSLAARSFREAKLLWISDALRREEFRTQQSIQALQLSMIVCVPMTGSDGPIGMIAKSPPVRTTAFISEMRLTRT